MDVMLSNSRGNRNRAVEELSMQPNPKVRADKSRKRISDRDRTSWMRRDTQEEFITKT